MEGLHHPIHAGFGRPLEGAWAFYFKPLSIRVICVIGGFNTLFRDECSARLASPGSAALAALADIAAVASAIAVEWACEEEVLDWAANGPVDGLGRFGWSRALPRVRVSAGVARATGERGRQWMARSGRGW